SPSPALTLREAIMRAIGIALGILSLCRATADSQAYSPKAGVGMAFIIASPAGQLAGFLNVFVPVNLGSHFRLEPQIGWHTRSFDDVANDPSSPTNSLSGSSRVLLLGDERSEEHTSELQSRGHLVCRL